MMWASLLILATSLLQSAAYPIDSSTRLVRTMKGGDAHLYEVSLAAGQFLWVIVDQRSLDVGVTAVDPQGTQIAFSDNPNGPFGPEPLAIIAEQAGTYSVRVAPLTPTAPEGSYEIHVEALRPATDIDREHVSALESFAEGQRLRAQNTAESRLQAVARYEQALAFFRSSGDRFNEVLTVYRIALVRANSSDFRSALDGLIGVLPVAASLGEPQMAASVLNLAGGAFDALGDLSNAVKYYGDALVQFRAIGSPRSEAAALNNVGKIAYDTADWQTALDNFTQAAVIFQSIGDQVRESIALRNVGQIHMETDDIAAALEFYGRALRLRRAAGDKAGEAEILTSIGSANVRADQRDRAIEAYTQALALRRTVGDPRGIAQTLTGFGAAYAAFGETPKAAEYYEDALPLLRSGGDRRQLALLLNSIADVRNRQQQPAIAVTLFRESLGIFQSLGDKQNESRALQGLAHAQRELGQLGEARASIVDAVAQLERVRAGLVSQEMRASYLASQQDAYQLLIDIEMRAGNHAAGLEASERARARSLLEMLTEAQVDIRRGVDSALLDREKRVTRLIDAKAERLMQLPAAAAGQARAAAFRKEIADLEAEYEQARAEIRAKSPAFAAIVQPQPLDLRAIQQLLDDDTVLVEYSLGRERSFAWTVTPSSLHGYTLPAQDEIERAARTAYGLITARSSSKAGESSRQKQDRVAQADLETPASIHELSGLVLAPLQSDLNRKRIVVVADGALQYVPFGMLSLAASAAYRPLVADAEIVSAPSASAVAVQRSALAARQAPTKGIAIIADPVFSVRDGRVRNVSAKLADGPAPVETAAATRILEHFSDGQTGSRTIPRLPFTADEARKIESVAGGVTHRTALGFDANLSTTMDPDLGNYRYVHIATHGYLDAERPDLSALVLSMVDDQGRSRDGFLRAREVYNLSLPAELVVLSACETGLGKEIRGEGLVGLTRGFMYAGAARVAVSLWSVSDKATADLMRAFYEAMLKRGERPAAALRAAQLEMMKQKSWSAPYYWAAFVLQGEWQ